MLPNDVKSADGRAVQRACFIDPFQVVLKMSWGYFFFPLPLYPLGFQIPEDTSHFPPAVMTAWNCLWQTSGKHTDSACC